MKKYTTTILLLLCFVSYGQWSYNSGISDFDGTYRTSSVTGRGGSFPYNNPILVVNKFENTEFSLYISGAGYSGCGNKVIFFKFNGNENIYESYSVKSDSNNESWFIGSMEDIQKFQLLELFMKHSSVSVRMQSDCGSKDYIFSLGGSTKAINYVLGKEYIRNLREKSLEEKREKEQKLELEEQKLELEKENELKFLKVQESQLKSGIGQLDSLFKKAEIKLKKDNLYFNIVDIKAYRNIYDIEYKFIIPRKTLIEIDNDYYNKNYFKIKYVGKDSYSYYPTNNIFLEKKYLKKLFK
jgi:hypothetical protein